MSAAIAMLLCAMLAPADGAGAQGLFRPGAGEWITCDLGDAHTVSRVVLLPRPLAHGYCARDFRVLLSTDGEHWSIAGEFHKPSGQLADTFDVPPTEARYVKLWIVTSWETAPGSNNVQIAELEVYTADGRNLARAATLSAGSQEERHPVEHANDGDPTTFWASAGGVVNQVTRESDPRDAWPRGAATESGILPGLFARFREPPNTYRPKAVWFFNDTPTDEQTTRQLEAMRAARLAGPAVFAYRGLPVDYYLSEGWLGAIKHAADECARLGLDMWILDEGSYPSGFADGRVTDAHPELRSKALRVAEEREVHDGEVFAWTAGAELVVAVTASRPAGYEGDLQPRDLTGELVGRAIRWTCAGGPWVVRVFVQRLESHPARAVSTGGRKDTTHSLPDYLRRDATQRFLEVTHEAYASRFGDRFGSTVKGFFGDEPGLPELPWTDLLPERFLAMKGYDIRPHLGALVGAPHPDAPGIIYDYYEVVASLWRSEWFQPQTDWCAEHGMTYTGHLCGEDDMMTLVHGNDADFFACQAGIAEPGIDVIWRQVFAGCTNDFPKLGGSAANVWGKPRAMTESFAVFGSGTTYAQMKFVTDYQLVRGVDDLFLMEWCYSPEGWRRLMHPPDFSPDSTLYPYLGDYCDYTARGALIATEGVPIAPVAVYYPTRSLWLGDREALASAERIARLLFENQVGFEWVDDNGLAECCEPVDGGMRNRSGTLHTTLIVPEGRVMGPAAAERVSEFLHAGGTAVFVGRVPERFGGFRAAPHPLGELLAQPAPSTPVGKGTLVRVASPEEAVARSRAAMPATTTEPRPGLRLAGAQVDGAQVWLATNEAEEAVDTSLHFAGECAAEEWDLETGTARPALATAEPDSTLVRLRLPAEGSRVLVVAPGRAVGRAEPAGYDELVALDGDWTWTFLGPDGATRTGPLVPWAEAGRPEYSGDVRYEASFDLPKAPPGRTVLDLGDVRYMVEVRLNGALVGRRLWPPYALDVTGLLRAGRNTLDVRVTNTPANRFFARAEDRQRAEEAGWFEGTYVGTYERFEGDSLRSGLLGPVRVLRAVGETAGFSPMPRNAVG